MGPNRIAAVVLAAGGSSRLGQPKQLLDLGGIPLLEHVLRTVRLTGVDDRFVVLGHAANEIRIRIPLNCFQEINNPDFIDGQSTSVVSAVTSIPDDVAAIIFVLGDQPLQTPEVIDRLVASYRAEPASIIQPEFCDGPGNPVLIDRSLFPELAKLTGDTGARPIIRDRKDEIRRIDCSEWSRPDDVDTPADFERVQIAYSEMSNAEDR